MTAPSCYDIKTVVRRPLIRPSSARRPSAFRIFTDAQVVEGGAYGALGRGPQRMVAARVHDFDDFPWSTRAARKRGPNLA